MNSVNHRRHLPYRIEFVIEGDLFSRVFVPQVNHESCSLHTEVLQVHDLCKPAAGHENSSLFVSWDQGVFFGPPNPERFLKSCVSILAEEDMLCFSPMVQTAPSSKMAHFNRAWNQCRGLGSLMLLFLYFFLAIVQRKW